MDILATLQNCVNAVAGIRPRIDQPEIYQTGQALINTLKDMIPEVKGLMDRVAQLEKEKEELQAAAQDEQDPEEDPET
jgi:vacuolar-type H+-ATPase subunit I/STV1